MDNRKIVSATVTPSKGWGGKASVDVTLDDNSEMNLFKFYDDEINFTASEFIGKTVDEGLDLKYRKDKAYLQS